MATHCIKIGCLIDLWNLKKILKINPDPMCVKYEGLKVASDHCRLEPNLIFMIPKFF